MKTFGELTEVQSLENNAVIPNNNADDTESNKITFANLKKQILGSTPSDISINGTDITVSHSDGSETTLTTQDTTYTGTDGVKLDNGVFKADIKSETKSTLPSNSMGDTTDRQYAVGLDSEGYLSVNVPWTDTVPTKVSDLTNDSGFITDAVNDLTNYYLKSETYTKSEVDTIISAIKTSRFEVVDELPTEDIKTNVIYIVPKPAAKTNNAKEEYINLDGTTEGWEKIGETEPQGPSVDFTYDAENEKVIVTNMIG